MWYHEGMPKLINPTPENIGRLLVARRKRVEHTCPQCGTAFVGYASAVYCSPYCRVKAWRLEQRSKLKAESGEENQAPELHNGAD